MIVVAGRNPAPCGRRTAAGAPKSPLRQDRRTTRRAGIANLAALIALIYTEEAANRSGLGRFRRPVFKQSSENWPWFRRLRVTCNTWELRGPGDKCARVSSDYWW